MALELDYSGDSFTLGDTIADPFATSILGEGEPVDLSGATVTAAFTDPAGTSHALGVTVTDAANGEVELEPTVPLTLTPAGVWTLAAHVYQGSSDFQTAPTTMLVADPADDWVSLTVARAQWRDAPDDDLALWRLLQVAKGQVLEYGPDRIADEIATTGVVPTNYLQAQLMQARNIWNAAKVDPAGTIGGEPSFAFTPFPLDWQVRQVIRSKAAKAVVR